MRISFICFVSVLFFYSFSIAAQNYVFSRNLQWTDNIIRIENNQRNEYLYFNNAVYNNVNNQLPYFFELFEVNNSIADFNVTIEEKVFNEISIESLKNIKQLNCISENIEIQYELSVYRKKSFLSVSFLPLRKNPVSGKIEKLISFRIRIEQMPTIKSKEYTDTKSYATKSVLASGKWYKIKIKESGIYKLTYQELQKMGFSDPENIRLYGNGGTHLPLMNNQPAPDDLIENAIYIDYGTDGIFNQNDYILFYAQGTVKWQYDSIAQIFKHVANLYTDTAVYFLTTNSGGKKIVKSQKTSVLPNQRVVSFNELTFHERNDTNLLRSGRTWYGETFSVYNSYDFKFAFPNRIVNENIKLYFHVLGHSSSSSYYHVSINNSRIGSVRIRPFGGSQYTDSVVNGNYGLFSVSNGTKDITLKFEYQKLPSDYGFLDFIDINVRSTLTFLGQQMMFRDINSVGQGNISEFVISNAKEKLKVWDITDIYNVKEMELSGSASEKTFIIETNELKEFIAFDGSGFYTPVLAGEVMNQNLHTPEKIDMVIVTHENFLKSAQKLADFHYQSQGMQVKVVTQNQVFNEFSSGKTDPAAIRNYMRMLYDRSADLNHEVKHLLLFGDGSYDYRSTFNNFIVTYQTENSVVEDESFVSDDFFGMLDENEGEGTGLLDIGIGRFPVADAWEADNMVNKVIRYSQPDNLADWQNSICFIGDDEDGLIHMTQADSLANIVKRTYPAYNIDKIYLDAFPQEQTAVGDKYPDVNKAINNLIKKGALLINYVGHGGEHGLAHERILGKEEINSWNNLDRLPLFVTATCEFSRYDDKNLRSAGEKVLLNANGGGLAMFTTTRVVWSYYNFILNRNFYQFVFANKPDGEYYSLGEIISLTKNISGANSNKRNFTLLGDPAVKLKYPVYKVVTDSVNGLSINNLNDTLKAFDKVTISGHITDNAGNLVNDFTGIVYPVVFDKAKRITTLNNDGVGYFRFNSQNNVIYKGAASVEKGLFSFSFIVPKDIAYNFGNGRISYYAHNYSKSATGYNEDIIIGGTSDRILSDSIGPEIELFLNDENFISGGLTDKNPVLIAYITDSSGINTVGNGIGHDITVIIDDSTKFLYILNDYYQATLNSYQSGKLQYQLNNLSSGKHFLKLIVWDILNNSSEATLEFIVEDSAQMALKRVFNYPNPFTETTAFYIEHNQANTEMEVMVQIFTVTGKIVKTIQTTLLPSGFLIGPIPWDGTDDYGDKIGRGVYIYRVKIRTSGGKAIEKYEKLVILK